MSKSTEIPVALKPQDAIRLIKTLEGRGTVIDLVVSDIQENTLLLTIRAEGTPTPHTLSLDGAGIWSAQSMLRA